MGMQLGSRSADVCCKIAFVVNRREFVCDILNYFGILMALAGFGGGGGVGGGGGRWVGHVGPRE